MSSNGTRCRKPRERAGILGEIEVSNLGTVQVGATVEPDPVP
ncbi:hypothetical protein [Paenibacillus silviterrae]|nr:hypothetical protein [Paenibacillus chinjuensis]